MDKIILNQMSFYGFHGLLPEEKKLGQQFTVDVELYTDLKKPGKSDDMNDSINYAEVYGRVREVVEGKSKNLMEAVAEQIAGTLLGSIESLSACTVKVAKPEAPIPGHFQSAAVEIFREKSA